MNKSVMTIVLVVAISLTYISFLFMPPKIGEKKEMVAVFMTIPDGDIVIESRVKYLNLQPEDEIYLSISGEMVPAKFINFFSRILSEDGAEVLRGVSGDFSPGEKEEINNRQLRKLLAKFEMGE